MGTDVSLLQPELQPGPEAAPRRGGITAGESEWGGWGSNPRPADYEKRAPVLPVRYLHGYHRVVPQIALIAPLAQVTRSTNRSTPRHGDHRMSTTERYSRPADQHARGGIGPQ